MFTPCIDSLLTSIRSTGSESRKASEEVAVRIAKTSPQESCHGQGDEAMSLSREAISGGAEVEEETLFL